MSERSAADGLRLPLAFESADRTSLDGQRTFTRFTALVLLLLVVAAVGGAFEWSVLDGRVDLPGAVALAAFALSAGVKAYLLSTHPERDWYDGRAVAESVKTLSWRYAVGGEPFPVALDAFEADRRYVQRVAEILRSFEGRFLAPAEEHGEQITEDMRATRRLSLSERKALYLQSRVLEEQVWYSRRARLNRERAAAWSLLLLGLDGAGILAGVLKATGVTNVDVLGIAAALAAGAVAWTQMKQHLTLARSYSIAAHELSLIRELVAVQETEQEWVGFVDDAEAAISREHTLWKAQRAHAVQLS